MWKTFLYRLALKKHMTKHVEPGNCDKLFSMEDCYKAVVSALKVGYMELDTASACDNERENLFIQTKLWRSFVGQ